MSTFKQMSIPYWVYWKTYQQQLSIDGARYVGRYELTCGEQLVVGFDGDDALEARVLAKTERRLKFTPA